MMLRLPGKYNNTVRYFFDGYIFHRDARGAGLTFRCATRGVSDCTAVIYVNSLVDIEQQEINLINAHYHPGNALLYLEEKFKIDIKNTALERASEYEPKDIFDLVIGKDE